MVLMLGPQIRMLNKLINVNWFQIFLYICDESTIFLSLFKGDEKREEIALEVYILPTHGMPRAYVMYCMYCTSRT